MLPHLPQAGSERLWPRGVRIAVLKIRDNARRAALRCLIGNAVWSQERKYGAGLSDSSMCKLCGKNDVGSLGHQIYDCDAVLNHPAPQSNCFPDDILLRRSELRDTGRFEAGMQVWDSRGFAWPPA
eukprot:2915747-Pyramimonas_sp.AAC.1